MTFDDVLVRHVGHFGRFQGLALFLTFMSSLPVGWHILAYLFIGGGAQDYWCALPANDFGNTSLEQLKEIYIPSETKNGRRKFSSCEIYDFEITNISTLTLDRLRSGDIVNGSDVRGNMTDRRRCTQWEYGQKGRYFSSILTQYKLYCEKEWLIPVAQSCIMAGWLVGNFVFGSLADRFGRMRVIPVGFLMSVVIGLIMPFIPNYYAYLLFRFFLGVTTGGSYTVCFVLIMEYCGTKHRVSFSTIFHCGFNSSVALISGVAYAMAPINHITMQIILGCVPLLLVFTKLFATALIYYGLMFIGGSLGATIYINTAISGCSGIVGSFASIPVLKYLGRRTAGVSSLFIMTISLFVSIFLIGKPEYESALIAVVFVGKFFNVVAFDTIYLHSAEIFPTCIRTLGVGTGSLWARVGALLAPLIAKTATIWPILPVIVFCSCGALATCMALLLPETRGRHLPETIEEGEKFSRLSLSCPWILVDKGEMTDIYIANDSDTPC